MKALSMEIVVIIMQMSTHITMVAFVPEPTHKIIIGPKAILGKLFKIMR